jgi:hypothetical protein
VSDGVWAQACVDRDPRSRLGKGRRLGLACRRSCSVGTYAASWYSWISPPSRSRRRRRSRSITSASGCSIAERRRGVRKLGHAAGVSSYSWMRPPSRSRRRRPVNGPGGSSRAAAALESGKPEVEARCGLPWVFVEAHVDAEDRELLRKTPVAPMFHLHRSAFARLVVIAPSLRRDAFEAVDASP